MRVNDKKGTVTSLAMSMGLTAAALSAYMLTPTATFAQSCNGGGSASEGELTGSCDTGSGDGGSGSNYCTDLSAIYQCAAIKIDKLDGWARVACYAALPTCLAIEASTCVSEGCQELGSGSGM